MALYPLVPSNFRSDLDPFKSFRRELERFFDDLWKRPNLETSVTSVERERTIFPDIDVVENEKAFQIAAELPGLEEKDIKVEVNNNILTIKGEKKLERENKQNNYYITERSKGFFYRAIQLPTAIEKENIEATIKNGVLTLTLPKAAESITNTKHIEIKKI
jgi:HSP20 family protein